MYLINDLMLIGAIVMVPVAIGYILYKTLN